MLLTDLFCSDDLDVLLLEYVLKFMALSIYLTAKALFLAAASSIL